MKVRIVKKLLLSFLSLLIIVSCSFVSVQAESTNDNTYEPAWVGPARVWVIRNFHDHQGPSVTVYHSAGGKIYRGTLYYQGKGDGVVWYAGWVYETGLAPARNIVAE